MLGFGLPELLIIGVVLICVIGVAVGVLVLVVSLLRRREAGRTRAPLVGDAGAHPRQRR